MKYISIIKISILFFNFVLAEDCREWGKYKETKCCKMYGQDYIGTKCIDLDKNDYLDKCYNEYLNDFLNSFINSTNICDYCKKNTANYLSTFNLCRIYSNNDELFKTLNSFWLRNYQNNCNDVCNCYQPNKINNKLFGQDKFKCVCAYNFHEKGRNILDKCDNCSYDQFWKDYDELNKEICSTK